MIKTAPDQIHPESESHSLLWRHAFAQGACYVYLRKYGPVPKIKTKTTHVVANVYTAEQYIEEQYVDVWLGYVWVPNSISRFVNEDDLAPAPSGITYSKELDDGHVYGFDCMQGAMETWSFNRPRECDLEFVKAETIELLEEIINYGNKQKGQVQ